MPTAAGSRSAPAVVHLAAGPLESAAASASIVSRAAARYSGTSPSTMATSARPLTDSERASSGVLPVSMDSETSGRSDSDASFGELVAVDTTNSSPVQEKPTGTTLGDPVERPTWLSLPEGPPQIWGRHVDEGDNQADRTAVSRALSRAGRGDTTPRARSGRHPLHPAEAVRGTSVRKVRGALVPQTTERRGVTTRGLRRAGGPACTRRPGPFVLRGAVAPAAIALLPEAARRCCDGRPVILAVNAQHRRGAVDKDGADVTDRHRV